MNVEGTHPDRPSQALSGEGERTPHQPPEPPPRGFRRFLLPAAIALVILAGAGWLLVTRLILPLLFGGHSAPPPTPVGLANPKRVTVNDSSEYAASLDSRQSVTLQPRVSGQISTISVKAGDRVEAGTVLIQIDADAQRAQVESRAAAAATSAAEIDSARTDVTNARDTLSSLQARRAASLSEVQLNQREYDRYKDLYNQGASSRQILDQRLNALQTSQANLRQAEADLRVQQSAIAKAQTIVERNRRAFQQSQATVSEGAAQLRYYTITAPFAGVVGDIPAKVGDFVDTSTRLLTLTQNQELEVQIAIPLEKAAVVRRGTRVELLNDQGKVLQTGQVSFVAPDVDPSTQSVQVKAVFNNQGGKLRTQQFARARVIWDTRPGVLVPTTAIARLAGKDFVFVAAPFQNSSCKAAGSAEAPGAAPTDPNQMVAVQKNIKLGRIIGNDQEALEGLTPNDRIVTSGILNLQNCAPIAEAPPEAAAPKTP